MTNPQRIASGAFGLLLSACASLPPSQIDPQHWQMSGRIGLWQNQQQESGQLSWLQCGNHYSKIRLTGPVGVGGAEIISTADGASVDYRGEHHRAANAETLAADIGWPLPVSALRFWLRGQAAPDAPLSAKLSASGQLSELQQYGWHIQFSRHSDSTDALPKSIDARRDKLRLKLIIKTWRDAQQECQP